MENESVLTTKEVVKPWSMSTRRVSALIKASRLPSCQFRRNHLIIILRSTQAILLVAFLVGSAIISPPSVVAARKPNIILILADDLGHADIGAYGQRRIKTPHIDRLAAEGMRFTQAYAGATVCAPSRSALMTGLHTGHTPVRANAGGVPLQHEDITIAEVLKRAGYATGGFGKWGLGDAGTTGVPHQQGFDEFFGYLHQIHAHSYYPEFLWKNDQKHSLPGNLNGKHEQYSADLIAEQSLRFIRQHKDRPFFLYAAFTLPHGKFEVPSDAPYSGESWPQQEKNFAAMVTRLDDQVGMIMQLLKDLGLDRETVVYFTSDNGAPLGKSQRAALFRSNGSLRGEKGNLYEGGIRVPLVVRWPGHIAPGSTSDRLWASWDFMPTIAALGGAQAPPNIDGISALPILLDARADRTARQLIRSLYWEHYEFNWKLRKLLPETMTQAVRKGDWKVVRTRPGAPLELYDLRGDPGEATNVAADHPRVVAEFDEYLKTARTEMRAHDTGNIEYQR